MHWGCTKHSYCKHLSVSKLSDSFKPSREGWISITAGCFLFVVVLAHSLLISEYFSLYNQQVNTVSDIKEIKKRGAYELQRGHKSNLFEVNITRAVLTH